MRRLALSTLNCLIWFALFFVFRWMYQGDPCWMAALCFSIIMNKLEEKT